MTHDQMFEVIQAHKAGKIIECGSGESWTTVDRPKWNFGNCCYRVKPEPKVAIGYVNIWPDKTSPSCLYMTRADADLIYGARSRTACVRVEFTYVDGQFDE